LNSESTSCTGRRCFLNAKRLLAAQAECRGFPGLLRAPGLPARY